MVLEVTVGIQIRQGHQNVQLANVIDQIEVSADDNSYQTLNLHYGFHGRGSTAREIFAENAASRLMTGHRQLVKDIKAELTERKIARRSVMASIRECVFGSLREYSKNLRLAWSMTDSENRNLKTLGWEITVLKTLGYLPYMTGIIGATVCIVSAVALPIFATSFVAAALAKPIGICLIGAASNFGLGYMHKLYMDFMWEDELVDFGDYRLEDFMKRKLLKGFETLQDKLQSSTYDSLTDALAHL